jgi:cytidylate kinase
MKLNEGINDKWIFKAIFLAGSPGSGKNFFSKKILYNFKNIDPDQIREFILKRKNITLDSSKQTPDQLEYRKKIVDPTAYKKAEKKENIILKERLPIIINRTGKDIQKTIEVKNKLEKLGYEIKMIFVSTDLDIALKRNSERERKLEKDIIVSTFNTLKENIKKYKNIFGNDFHQIDNSKSFNENKVEYENFWKKIAKWMDKPVNNQAANKWKEEQRLNKSLQKVKKKLSK